MSVPQRRADLAVRIHGKARTKGSVTAFVPCRPWAAPPRDAGGRIVVRVLNDADKDGNEAKIWADTVAASVRSAMNRREMAMIGQHVPVVVEMVFYRPRGVGHHGTGRNADRIKPSAPAQPAVLPDVDKLVRCALDALKGIVYADDGQVTTLLAKKEFGPPCLELRVWELPKTVADATTQPMFAGHSSPST